MFRQASNFAVRALRNAALATAEVCAPAAATQGRHYASSVMGYLRQPAASGLASGAAFALAITSATGAAALCATDARRERSFIMVKPDGVQRGLISDIMKRFEGKGYKLVGVKVLVPAKELAGKHYAEHEGRPFFPKLVNFLSSGPVVAMVWEGKEVIKYGRTMIGATNPLASAPGTIRGDYGIDVGRNIIHGSDSVDSAQREIALWFDPSELVDFETATAAWVYE